MQYYILTLYVYNTCTDGKCCFNFIYFVFPVKIALRYGFFFFLIITPFDSIISSAEILFSTRPIFFLLTSFLNYTFHHTRVIIHPLGCHGTSHRLRARINENIINKNLLFLTLCPTTRTSVSAY